MSCSLKRPDPQTLFNRIRDQFSATVLGGSPIIPESNEWYVVANDYAVAEEFYSIAEQQWRERDPRTACCENLIKLAAIDGIYPRPATLAEGYIKLTGEAGAPLIGALEVAFGDALYRPAGQVPAQIDVSGQAIIRYKAVEPGNSGNGLNNPTVGRLVGPLNNVDREASVYGNRFCGGDEAEACEPFRQRYLARKRYQPRATLEWIKNKILEWPCVTRVCQRGGNCCIETDECGCAQCGGKLQFYPLMDGTFDCGLPPQCVIDEIDAWLWGTPAGYGMGQVEVGVCGKLYAAEPAIIDITLDGLACLAPSQIEEIRSRLEEFFGTLCPSELVCKRNIDTIVAQEVGNACDFDIAISSTSQQVRVTRSEDIDPECDILPCLGEINIIGPQVAVDECA